MSLQTLQNGYAEAKLQLDYLDADELFSKVYGHFSPHFLMESKQVSLFSGRFSLIGLGAPLHIRGKDDQVLIRSLNERGEQMLKRFSEESFSYASEVAVSENQIELQVPKDTRVVEESQRPHLNNGAQVLRTVLESFACKKKVLMGLYGAFSYDFIRLFEDLGDELPPNETPDFSLFLYDSFLFFDHIKKETSLVVYRSSGERADSNLRQLADTIGQLSGQDLSPSRFTLKDQNFSLSQEAFEEMVMAARQYIKEGEIFQIVFSNILKAGFSGDPFALYQQYREKNPSPYLFYYDMGEEQLIGASPEMMVRCEEGLVHLRPIAGTTYRGEDPVDDHDQMIELLTNPKERAELDMLIDLGRNDLSRICKPGIHIDDYRFVEKYSRVMHTVAHLTGTLKEGYTGLDALISCLNAGTLTGAPKVAAMRLIEHHEQERRGYYGGALGQLAFSGEVDTTIFIRSAHIRNGQLRYQSGAGIVYDSDPTKEYQETLHKAQAFLDIFS